jgi:hypothetical protein
VGAEGAATILQCAECERPWLHEDTEHWWSAYLTDDEPPEVVFFCPNCAQREFGTRDDE